MTVIVCVGENGAMLFGGRRVSSDKAVISDLLSCIGDASLYMSQYSCKLFPEDSRIRVCDDSWKAAGCGDAVFLEQAVPDGLWAKTRKLIVYHWNRLYPSDVRFPMDDIKTKFKLEQTHDLTGNSHEKITREVYVV